jgi:four helix bundle protein
MMNDERDGKLGENGDVPFDLRARTKKLALRVIRLYSALDKRNSLCRVIGNQLLRSGTSVGAHYREATRARSVAEFVSKIEGGLQELEETAYWIELLIDAQLISETRLRNLSQEIQELLCILVASAKTAKKRKLHSTLNNER